VFRTLLFGWFLNFILPAGHGTPRRDLTTPGPISR
jgi:hypothetical protein